MDRRPGVRTRLGIGARSALAPSQGVWLLPVASALLLAASYPPLHLLVPPFVALVPFAVWVARLSGDGEGARSAMLGGLVLGVAMHGLLLHWIVPALAWVTAWAVPVFFTVLAVLSALAALFGLALHRAVHRLAVPVWLALPLSWTGVEWLQAHLPGGLAFPWLGLGTSLTGHPEVVGIAELVGARGVTFWLALANGVLASWILSYAEPRRRRAMAAVALVAVVALPVAWGMWRATTLETRTAGHVAVVGTDLSAEIRADVARWREAASTEVAGLLAGLGPGEVDLVVLPEGMLVGDVRDGPEQDGSLAARLRAQAERIRAPILVGAYVPEGREGARNSAVLMQAGGVSPFRYDKRRLVPLVETTRWAMGIPGAGFEAGRSGRGGREAGGYDRLPLEVRGAALGVLICFEASFASDARAARRAGANVLVNITNDGWFGVAGAGSRAALHQHAAHLVMRAVETRAGAVRAANGGFSFFVDPVGRVHGAVEPGASAVSVATVRTTDVSTFYARHGDVLGPASALAALLFILSGGFRVGPPVAAARQRASERGLG